MQHPVYTLLIDCTDQKGLVHHITGVLYRQGVNVTGNQEFVEHEYNRFFMRTTFEGLIDEDEILKKVRKVLPPGAHIRLGAVRKKRLVVLVTKEQHCLAELLVRNQFGELNAEIEAVIGNHEILERFTHQFGVNYHQVPHENKTRERHEAEILEVIQRYKPDFLVLAKYTSILSPAFVGTFPNTIVHLHHSFLNTSITIPLREWSGKKFLQKYPYIGVFLLIYFK